MKLKKDFLKNNARFSKTNLLIYLVLIIVAFVIIVLTTSVNGSFKTDVFFDPFAWLRSFAIASGFYVAMFSIAYARYNDKAPDKFEMQIKIDEERKNLVETNELERFEERLALYSSKITFKQLFNGVDTEQAKTEKEPVLTKYARKTTIKKSRTKVFTIVITMLISALVIPQIAFDTIEFWLLLANVIFNIAYGIYNGIKLGEQWIKDKELEYQEAYEHIVKIKNIYLPPKEVVEVEVVKPRKPRTPKPKVEKNTEVVPTGNGLIVIGQ